MRFSTHGRSRMLYNVYQSSSCLYPNHRQSQLASQGPVALAEKLTQSLRHTGDLDLVEIDLEPYVLMSAHSANTPLNRNRVENHICHGTMTKSCFQRHGDLSLLNRSCSLFVHQSSGRTHCLCLSQRRSRRRRAARAILRT